MINISDDVKTLYLADSASKELTVRFGDSADEVNWYYGDEMIAYENSLNLSPGTGRNLRFNNPEPGGTSPYSNDIAPYTDVSQLHEYSYLYASIKLKFDSYSNNNPLEVDFWVQYYDSSGESTNQVPRVIILPEDYYSYGTITLYVSTADIENISSMTIGISNPLSSPDSFNGRIEFKELFIGLGDNTSKFPYPYSTYPTNFDSYVVTNDNLVSESFSLNESLCSEHNIKFGLCEAAYCQFTVADDAHDYKDMKVRPYLKLAGIAKNSLVKDVNLYNHDTPVPGASSPQYYTWRNRHLPDKFTSSLDLSLSPDALREVYISMFNFVRITFKVKLDITAYDIMPYKMVLFPSAYVRVDYYDEQGQHHVGNRSFISYWEKYPEFTEEQNFVVNISDVTSDYITATLDIPIRYRDYYSQFGQIYVETLDKYGVSTLFDTQSIQFRFLDANDEWYTDSTKQIAFTMYLKEWQINYIKSKDSIVPDYDVNACAEYSGLTIAEYINDINTPIPLGVFTVDSIKKNYVNDILKQEITAYDRIRLLEQNAADWYTQYMFGVDGDGWEGMNLPGFEYARQIYSTYFNYAKTIGLEDKSNYTETVIAHNYYEHADEIPMTSDILVSWGATTKLTAGKLQYAKYSVPSVDVSKMYVVNVYVPWGGSPFIPKSDIERYLAQTNYPDPLGRGLITGNILIKETRPDGKDNKYCVDAGDYFMVSPDCESLDIYIAITLHYTSSNIAYMVSNYDINIDICEVETKPDLPNGHVRLCYYEYRTRTIFDCDSSVTGRDVVRSLLEVNGCFYRLNRATGKPEFIYCNKSSLYPSDTLYPSDILYPRIGVTEAIDRSKYQSFIQEDYEVQSYGKIQILKKITSNQTKSVVEWEFVGNPNNKNSYLIEDNIFYCNKGMEYDYDGMPEVAEMLQNMWNRVSNLNYIPCVLTAKGMPWIECGDRLGVLTKTGGAESFIFHRTLKGIQSLTDVFESEGDEYNEEIKDYGYKIIGG